jgi:hypothetical protein
MRCILSWKQVWEGMMRFYVAFVMILTLVCACLAQEAKQQPQTQQPAMPTQFGDSAHPAPAGSSREAKLSAMFQEKIKTEWEAIKHKDKKAYGELLADDYEGVEVDGRGERTKIQAVNELLETNVFDYTLWGFKLIPAGTDDALVIYEVTMQFPLKSAVRFSRVYISELWENRAGQWKEVHYQETHVK